MIRRNFGLWFIIGALTGAALAVSLQRFANMVLQIQREQVRYKIMEIRQGVSH